MAGNFSTQVLQLLDGEAFRRATFPQRSGTNQSLAPLPPHPTYGTYWRFITDLGDLYKLHKSTYGDIFDLLLTYQKSLYSLVVSQICPLNDLLE